MDAPGHPGAWPGLLVEWRQDDQGEWIGRIAVIAGTSDQPRPVEIWMAARFLRPI